MSDEFDEFSTDDLEEFSQVDMTEAEWDEALSDMDAEQLYELRDELANTRDTLELPDFEPDEDFYKNLETEESALDSMLSDTDDSSSELEEMLNDSRDTDEGDEDWNKVLVKRR